jgi:hypothetical protein
MNPILTTLFIYIIGIIGAAFVLRIHNSFQKYKHECIPPPFCLLSWLTVVIGILGFLVYLIAICLKYVNISFEDIEKFLNFTDKE